MTAVYFIRPIDMNGPVKIGCSASPAMRLLTLARWSPFPLEIVAVIAGDTVLERRFHARFEHLHSHREWFKPSPEIDDVIVRIVEGTFDVQSLPAPVCVRARHQRSQETTRAIGYSVSLESMRKRGVPIPEAVLAATRTYNVAADEVSRRRAIVAAFVEAHRKAA